RTLNSTDSGTYTTSFQVGVPSGAANATLTVDAGNIKLVNASSTVGAIYTSGSFTVLANSRVNLGTSTTTGDVAPLRAGSIIIGTGATIADTFGAHSGYALSDATLGGSGNLTLNTFNLQLTYDGTGWSDGSDLLLFHFTGTLTGTPTLGTVTVAGFEHTGLFYDNLTKNIYLTGLTAVPVPEPGSAALLLGAFGGLVIWTVRRRKVA
ncbi:MAG: PEP-CTERM sorting domain-containing protein, partial [Chthoniobacterales bacterium]